jgi:hypothetical protein
MGGISYNVWLLGLCAGVSWFRTEEEESTAGFTVLDIKVTAPEFNKRHFI